MFALCLFSVLFKKKYEKQEKQSFVTKISKDKHTCYMVEAKKQILPKWMGKQNDIPIGKQINCRYM